MLRNYLLGLTGFTLAAGILIVSLFKTASIKYAFEAATPTPIPGTTTQPISVDYLLPYPGKVGPDSMLWPLKAARDNAWYKLTTNPLKRAEIALLFSDKRLVLAKNLFENKKPEIGFSTLTKSEKYLEIAFKNEEDARRQGMDTGPFLTKMATSSLKHRLTIDEILNFAPEDAKPEIIKIQNYSKDTYKFSRDGLNSKGIPVPKSPFTGD